MTLLEKQKAIIEELKKYAQDNNVEIEIRDVSDSKAQEKPDRLPKSEWKSVSVDVTPGMFEFERELYKKYGCYWDSGCGFGFRDYELDWSFHEAKGD